MKNVSGYARNSYAPPFANCTTYFIWQLDKQKEFTCEIWYICHESGKAQPAFEVLRRYMWKTKMNILLKQVLLVFVCFFALAGQAKADSLSEATRVYDEGDYEKAVKLYTPLAKDGNAEAQYVLGMMYRAGRGVPQDYKEARKWYRLAAEQGHPIAQFYLGWIYAGGKGVPKDYIQAHMWIDIAIANSSGEAKKEFIVDRDAIEKSMSADQIAKAKELAKKCTAKKLKKC